MNIETELSQSESTPVAVKPTISVVIPSFRSRHLEAVLDALPALDPREVIVVDSSPEPPDIAGIRLIHTSDRMNAATARNLGARKAKGDILLFVDADIVLASAIGAIVNEIAAGNGADIICGLYDSGADETAATRFQNGILRYRLHDAAGGEGELWSSSHFVIGRDAFLKTGGFDETLDIYEDMEFFRRCGFFGLTVRADPTFRAVHLKSFDLATVLTDYFRKTRAAIATRIRYPRLFKGHDGGIPPRLHAAGMLGLFTLVSMVCGLVAAATAGPTGAFLSGAAALAATTVFLFPGRALARATVAFRSYAAAVWTLCYGAIWLAIGISLVVASCRSVQRHVEGLVDFARMGVRVLFRTGRPVQIINYITSRCNLRCSHCFYKESLDDPNPGEIPRERLIKTMREIGPVLWYSLAGGEPFIRRDLEQLILDVQDICRPKVFSFPTNGWYTERTFESVQRALQRMQRGNLILFFSLDGPQDIHDKIRGKDSYGHLTETIARLRPLKAIHPNFYINLVTTVTPDNATRAPEFVRDIVREFEPDALSINLFRHHSLDAPKLPDDLIEAYDRTVDAYADEVSKGRAGGYGFVGSRILRAKEFLQKDLIYRVAKNNEFVTPCTAGTLSYVIMEDGTVKPCEILSDSIGNIYDEGATFGSIATSPIAKKTRDWIRDTKCRCTYECAMSTNTLFSWPMVPRLIRKTLFG